jgi:hypothetical protein
MSPKRPRRSRGVNLRGRSKKDERHLRLTHFMLGSIAWKSLLPVPRALFVELAQRWNGFNNGSIGLGVREAGEALHVKPHTAGLAFAVLSERGFLVLTKDSSFGQKKLAREWRVTCFPTGPWDAPTSPPTHDYMRWRPASEKQKPVPFGDTLSAVSGHTATENEAKNPHTVPLRGTKADSIVPLRGTHLCTRGKGGRDAVE